MIRRQKKISTDLSKISENSSLQSPSSITKQASKQRVFISGANRFKSKTITNKPQNKIESNRPNQLREQIMEKQRQLCALNQSFEARMHTKESLVQLIGHIVKATIRMSYKQTEAKWFLLKALKKGKKGVLEWLMGWVRVLFRLIVHALSQRRLVHK